MRAHTQHRPALRAAAIGRHTAVHVSAKLKIPQNHKIATPYLDGEKGVIDNDKLYTDKAYVPPPAFGPVKLVSVPGQGRGLALTAPCGLGSLLLVSSPAGPLVRAPEGLSLQHTHLLPVLLQESNVTEADRRRLRLLFNGKPESARQVGLTDFLPTSSKKSKEKAAATQKKAKGFATASPASTLPIESTTDAGATAPLTEAELDPVLRLNTWGQEYLDLSATALRGENSYSVAGVWPEFSLVNHSCIPNSVPVMVGNQLLLRSTRRNMQPGTQVTVNYLGFASASPLAERQRMLESNYSFTCRCPRCKLESSLPVAMRSVIDGMYDLLVQGFSREIQTKIVTQDRPGLQESQKHLERLIEQFESALQQQPEVDAEAHDWIRASCYGCYELLAVIKDELSQEAQQEERRRQFPTDETLPASLVPLVEVFAPGSDMHLFLTLEWLSSAGAKHGKDDARTAEATKACLRAHLTRYGRVSDALLPALVEARTKVAHHMGRVELRPATASA